MYENLTKNIPEHQDARFGEWVNDTQNDGTAEYSLQIRREKSKTERMVS